MEKAPKSPEVVCEHEYAKKSHEKVLIFMEHTLPEMHAFVDNSEFDDDVKDDIHRFIVEFFEKVKNDPTAKESLIISSYNEKPIISRMADGEYDLHNVCQVFLDELYEQFKHPRVEREYEYDEKYIGDLYTAIAERLLMYLDFALHIPGYQL